MRLNGITATAIAGLLAASLAAPVAAQDDAMMLHGMDALEKRQELMKQNGGTLRAAGSLTGDDAVAAAQTLVDNFNALKDLFPEDSNVGDTEALPTVWEDSEGFMMAMNNALQASETMLAVAQSGDMAAYADAVKGVGATCGACHQKYRVANN